MAKRLKRIEYGNPGWSFHRIEIKKGCSYWYAKKREGDKVITKYIGKKLPQRKLWKELEDG